MQPFIFHNKAPERLRFGATFFSAIAFLYLVFQTLFNLNFYVDSELFEIFLLNLGYIATVKGVGPLDNLSIYTC